MSEYLNLITDTLARIERESAKGLHSAANLVADTLMSDGLIYVFGCGHSHLAALDAFYRAGGLANVSPMLDSDLMLHAGAVKSSRLEKMSGIGAEIFRRYPVQKNDILVVISLSGKNAVPLEVLAAAKKKGIPTIGVSSSEYIPHGATMQDNCDIHIDCLVPYGDAAVRVGESNMGALSTAASCFILNTVLIEGARIAYARGIQPPVYISGNIEGGKAHNAQLEARYLGRVKHL